MSEILNELKRSEFTNHVKITYKEFKKAKKELSRSDFEKKYVERENSFYRLEELDVSLSDNEQQTYLMYKILNNQRDINRSLDVIKWIMILGMICGSLAALFIAFN